MAKRVERTPPGEKTSWSGDDKRRFRARKEWKDFVQEALEKQVKDFGHNFCAFCGSVHAGSDLDYHHLDPVHYDVLDHSKFKLLDTKCHELVEWMAIRLAKGGDSVPRRALLLEVFGDFLPVVKSNVNKEYKVAECLRK